MRLTFETDDKKVRQLLQRGTFVGRVVRSSTYRNLRLRRPLLAASVPLREQIGISSADTMVFPATMSHTDGSMMTLTITGGKVLHSHI